MRSYLKLLACSFTALALFVVPGNQTQAQVSPTICISLTKDLAFKAQDRAGQTSVFSLQSFLQSKGFLKDAPTGYFGNQTLKAVKEFQKSIGVNPTGYVGSQTRLKIQQISCAGVSQKVSLTSDVSSVQSGGTITFTASVASTSPVTRWQLSLECTSGLSAEAQIKGGLGCNETLGYVPDVIQNSYTIPVAFTNTSAIGREATFSASAYTASSSLIGISSKKIVVGAKSTGPVSSTTPSLVLTLPSDAGLTYSSTSTIPVKVTSNYASSNLKVILFHATLGNVYTANLGAGVKGVNTYSIPANTVTTTGQYKVGVCDETLKVTPTGDKDLCTWSANYFTVTVPLFTGGTINVSVDSTNPTTKTYEVNPTQGVLYADMQKFAVKATGGNVKLITVGASFTGQNPTTVYLYDGNTLIDSRVGGAAVTFSFSSSNITVAKDTTKVLTLKADYPKTTPNGATAMSSVTSVGYEYGGLPNTAPAAGVSGNVQKFSTAPVSTPTITVLYPNGGEQLMFGEKDIDFRTTWSATNLVGNVTAYLLYPDGGACKVGAAPATQYFLTAKLGSAYQCPNIPRTITAGQYKVLLAADNGNPTADPAAKDTSDAFFSVTLSPVVTGPAVTSYSLINADSDQVIAGYEAIANGAVLNLATLPTKNLNIRANVGAGTNSVKFSLSGAQSSTRIESGAPFSLMSDTDGNYFPWTPAVGTYTLIGTPYSKISAQGTMGTALPITFKVVNGTTAVNYSFAEQMANIIGALNELFK